MTMDDFHCRTFELFFGISAEEVDRDGLFAAAGGSNEGGSTQNDSEIALIFASRENPENYHAHMDIQFKTDDEQKDSNVQVHISFHNSKGKVEEEGHKPPYMEDCVRWLGDFIKRDKVTMGVTVFYAFESGYAPSVAVPYPVLSTEKILSGAMVTGLAIQFPPECMLDHALVQTVNETFGLSVSGHDEITVKKFDLVDELKRLEPTVMALTRKVEQTDETRDEE